MAMQYLGFPVEEMQKKLDNARALMEAQDLSGLLFTATANYYYFTGIRKLADSLYARQIFDGRPYCHMCSLPEAPEEMITIIGPSKTESLSGYRLGVAFGSAAIIQRMEKLLAIMALRCPGYNQGVFFSWFNEPAGWMAERVRAHQAIRDDILALLAPVAGVEARPTEGAATCSSGCRS